MRAQPLLIRLTHWLNAFAFGCMLMSGWMIYNASPLFGFRFPAWAGVGGWLGGAIAWHLAAAWLLVGNGIVYFGYVLLRGHWRRLRPPGPAGFVACVREAVRLRLAHAPGDYNAVQRWAYVIAFGLGLVLVASGLALWKPVQLQGLAAVMGGYEGARLVHFFAMSGLVAFTLLHVVMVVLVPSSLLAMLTGGPRVAAPRLEERR